MTVSRRSTLALAVSGLATPMAARGQTRPRVVLVHGAFEDATAWARVIPLLESRGIAATAVNLPGRAPDPSPPSAVTLESHRDAVVAVLAGGPPAVLVGHSFGGIVISAAAEVVPDHVARLVYLAAYLPRDGESLEALARQDRDGELGPGFQVDGPAGVARVREDLRVPLFCGGCDARTAAGFARSMVAEPLRPVVMPVRLTADRFGRIAKAYVRTTRDRGVSPFLQAAMLAATPVQRVLTLDLGHAPYNADPSAVAAALADAAG